MRRLFLFIRKRHPEGCDCYKCLKDECDNKYARDFKDVKHVLEDVPSTWRAYRDKKDGCFDILKMEFDELMACKEAGDNAGVVENLEHLAAAALEAHHKLTCKVY